MTLKTIVISASSDIGFEFVKNRSIYGESIIGTYRDSSSKNKLTKHCDHIVRLALDDEKSIDDFVRFLKEKNICWNKALFCASQPFPYRSFFGGAFDEWSNSFNVNTIYCLELLHRIYDFRASTSKVMFFAGGGSNSAVSNFSAYTSAKIHLIKMTELLDYENPDMTFSILGPGWVNTKNHLLALKHANVNSEKYKTTKEFLESPKGDTPICDVIKSINWIFSQDKEIVGGRNFSTAYDPWDTKDPKNKYLKEKLLNDFNMYKLRRKGNSIFPEKNY